jgi:2,4-dienoyl-CoA reductase-like NADH-dependent reductase (Old Yellow Enzyme family)
MAESMAPAPTHDPNGKMLLAYKEWAQGGWGMLLTGIQAIPRCSKSDPLNSLSRKCPSV